MSLVEQWLTIERGLPGDWGDARLRLVVADDCDPERAAALLGPVTPGRLGRVITFQATRGGAGTSSELMIRLLRRLDGDGIRGELELVGSDSPVVAAPAGPSRGTFASGWEAEVATLPEDWSDLYVEVELDSSDYLEPAALLLAPLNPARYGEEPGFRFRVARLFGYGASPEMAWRCFERLDDEGIRGRVQVLRALSDTRPVQTQGPVWHVGGKTV